MKITRYLFICCLCFFAETWGQSNPNKVPVSTQVANRTIKIIADNNFGTGFFYVVKLENGKNLYGIVTCRHVIKDANIGKMIFNIADENEKRVFGRYKEVTIDNFSSRWIEHPDTNSDLVFTPIDDIIRELYNEGISPFFHVFDKDEILSDDLLKKLPYINDVFMVGYPCGLSDTANNLPIFRKGITATHPAMDYNGEAAFLIDMETTEGSSGSPVFIIIDDIRNSNNEIIEGGRIQLLGVFSQDWDYIPQKFVNEGFIVKGKTVVPYLSANIGKVIKSSKLFELDRIIQKLYTSNTRHTE